MKQLETDRLILREWKEADSKDHYEYGKSELVGKQRGKYTILQHLEV